MERHGSAVVSVLHTGGLPGMAAPYYVPEDCWGMYCASAELLYGHLVALGGNLLVLHVLLFWRALLLQHAPLLRVLLHF